MLNTSRTIPAATMSHTNSYFLLPQPRGLEVIIIIVWDLNLSGLAGPEMNGMSHELQIMLEYITNTNTIDHKYKPSQRTLP